MTSRGDSMQIGDVAGKKAVGSKLNIAYLIIFVLGMTNWLRNCLFFALLTGLFT